MKLTARMILVMMITALAGSLPAHAGDAAFKDVAENAVYGGIAGALVGAATIVFTQKPSRHLENIGYGAAAGIMAGAAYGLIKSTRSLAELENGKIRFAIPTVYPNIDESPVKGQTTVTWRAELFRGTFN